MCVCMHTYTHTYTSDARTHIQLPLRVWLQHCTVAMKAYGTVSRMFAATHHLR